MGISVVVGGNTAHVADDNRHHRHRHPAVPDRAVVGRSGVDLKVDPAEGAGLIAVGLKACPAVGPAECLVVVIRLSRESSPSSL